MKLQDKKMNEKEFWNIIDRSIEKKKSVDMNLQADAIRNILKKYPDNEIVRFHAIMERLRDDLDSQEMRNVSHTYGYGRGFDVFDRFACWVIALGKKEYDRAKSYPDMLLIHYSDPEKMVAGTANFQDLEHIAPALYNSRKKLNENEWYELLEKYKKLEQRKQKKTKADRALEIKNSKEQGEDIER